MNKDLYNRLLAKIAYRHKLVTGEVLQARLKSLTPDMDLGRYLLSCGDLSPEHHRKLHNYLAQLSQGPDFNAKAQEILGGPVQRQRPAAKPPEANQTPPQKAAPVSGPGSVVEEEALMTVTVAKGEKVGPQVAEPEAPSDPPSPTSVTVGHGDEILPEEFRGSAGLGKLNIAIPKNVSSRNTLNEILLFARQHHASDLQLKPSSPILVRRGGVLKPVSKEPLTDKDIRAMLKDAIPSEYYQEFLEQGDLEYAHFIPGGGRYRIAAIKQRFGWEMTARVIPMKIRSFEDSKLPEACAELTKWAQGLVLVTGPLGCGKSSTLATLVELINQDRDDHIITVEKPVEVVYKGARCQITQREIGKHTLSQDNALRAALRQDPDIIVISELRDLASISLAVSAAETGHLVLATMNTANATRTVNRLIESYPPEEQDVVRGQISETLRGIISQQLIPRKDGNGLVAAYEVLVVTKAISNLIRKNNTHQLSSAMLSGRAQGMVLLDDALKQFISTDVITGEEAFFRATNPKSFVQYAPEELKDLANV